MAEPLLTVEHLSAGYDDVRVLWDIDFGIEGGIERALRRSHLAQDEVEHAARDIGVALLLRLSVRLDIAPGEHRVVVQHDLEVRDEPLGVGAQTLHHAASEMARAAHAAWQWWMPSQESPFTRLDFAVARIVGRQMMAKLMGKLSQQRRSRLLLEVRETNLDAQLFFRSLGFRAVSVLRGFYEDTPEDAYVMQYRYRMAEVPDVLPFNQITRRAG